MDMAGDGECQLGLNLFSFLISNKSKVVWGHLKKKKLN